MSDFKQETDKTKNKTIITVVQNIYNGSVEIKGFNQITKDIWKTYSDNLKTVEEDLYAREKNLTPHLKWLQDTQRLDFFTTLIIYQLIKYRYFKDDMDDKLKPG